MFAQVHYITHAAIGEGKRRWRKAGDRFNWIYGCGCIRHGTQSTFILCEAHTRLHERFPLVD
jgi:hypothetical protein